MNSAIQNINKIGLAQELFLSLNAPFYFKTSQDESQLTQLPKLRWKNSDFKERENIECSHSITILHKSTICKTSFIFHFPPLVFLQDFIQKIKDFSSAVNTFRKIAYCTYKRKLWSVKYRVS